MLIFQLIIQNLHKMAHLFLLIDLVKPRTSVWLLSAKINRIVLDGQERVKEIFIFLSGLKIFIMLGFGDHSMAVKVLDHRVSNLEVVGILGKSGLLCLDWRLYLKLCLLFYQEIFSDDKLLERKSTLQQDFLLLKRIERYCCWLSLWKWLEQLLFCLVFIILWLIDFNVIVKYKIWLVQDCFHLLSSFSFVSLTVFRIELFL